MTPRFSKLFLAAALLAGCGTGGLSAANPARGGAGFHAASSEAAGHPGIIAAFNATYGETIALNQPQAEASPTNTDKQLVSLIRNARTSIDGALYDIADPTAVAALTEAQARGVTVRLVTDTDNMVEKADPSRPRQAIIDLQAAGVAVRDDKRSAIMHHKFLIVDRKTVWMGSTNLTTTSLFAHNNNALTLESKSLADRYQREFNRLFETGTFGPDQTWFDGLLNPSYAVGTAKVQVYFSPKGGGKGAVVDAVGRARKSIHFMTFSLTDKELGQTLGDRFKAGVEVSGVFDRWLAAGQYSLFLPMKAQGMAVWKDGNEALMHHKVIVIDGETVITGSFNYSQNAEKTNNESFVIVRSPGLAKEYEAEFGRVSHAARYNRPPAGKPSFAKDVPPGSEQP